MMVCKKQTYTLYAAINIKHGELPSTPNINCNRINTFFRHFSLLTNFTSQSRPFAENINTLQFFAPLCTSLLMKRKTCAYLTGKYQFTSSFFFAAVKFFSSPNESILTEVITALQFLCGRCKRTGKKKDETKKICLPKFYFVIYSCPEKSFFFSPFFRKRTENFLRRSCKFFFSVKINSKSSSPLAANKLCCLKNVNLSE